MRGKRAKEKTSQFEKVKYRRSFPDLAITVTEAKQVIGDSISALGPKLERIQKPGLYVDHPKGTARH